MTDRRADLLRLAEELEAMIDLFRSGAARQSLRNAVTKLKLAAEEQEKEQTDG